MRNSIHGHEVLHLMLKTPQGFSTESLVQKLHHHFGPSTRFHTCSAEGLDAQGIVTFLEKKGKFHPVDETHFQTHLEKICNHT